jgi:dienelactone hydrolase
MPDFFEGKPADISWYPPQTEEHKQKLGEFFSGPAQPGKTLSRIPEVFMEANKLSPSGAGFDKWAILGYCWGGKVATLAAGEDNGKFDAGAEVHPAMVDPEDAKRIKIPYCVLASKDEPEDAVKGFEQNLTAPKHVETFSTQVHGWMAARADLENEEVRKEYERGYQTVLNFFNQHV